MVSMNCHLPWLLMRKDCFYFFIVSHISHAVVFLRKNTAKSMSVFEFFVGYFGNFSAAPN